MTYTTDPNDPRLGHGADDKPVPQNDVYLILSDEERVKGFIRPVRLSYIHIGVPPPTLTSLRELTNEEKERYAGYGYVLYEKYPESKLPLLGKFWTQKELNDVAGACGAITTMSRQLAETWARDPSFYGATYCVHCQKHLPVNEFVWVDDKTRLGT